MRNNAIQRATRGRWGMMAGLVLSVASITFGATREFRAVVSPPLPFTVTITLNPPPGTTLAAIEDKPPAGWIVSNIDQGGSFDAQSGKVKWGIYFAPSIPSTVSYDVVPQESTPSCFVGSAAFDGGSVAITGDGCAALVPTMSEWGLVVLALGFATAAGVMLNARRTRSVV